MEFITRASRELHFYVNGKRVIDHDVHPETTLLSYLRTKLGLCGTKLGCGEGGCGACTVMVSHYDEQLDKIVHRPVNACLAPVASVAEMAVTTVEGIGSVKSRLHPVQERIAKAHGSQCGFCTPGIVMSMYTLLRNTPEPTAQEIEGAFDGNLCRCTGYRPILEGFQSFARKGDAQRGCGMGDACCKNKPGGGCGDSDALPLSELFDASKFTPLSEGQEYIFPAELQLQRKETARFLHFKSPRLDWYRPTTLQELLILKEVHPAARIVVGNTEIGIEVKYKNVHYPVMIAATNIPQLNRITFEDGGVRIGASVTMATIFQQFEERIKSLPQSKTWAYAAVVENLRWFAGPQIRAVASLAGNIATATPISDLNPIWVAAGAVLTVASHQRGERDISMAKFFKGYRSTELDPDEVIVSLFLPETNSLEFFEAYKQARRREDDIAIVNAGMRVAFDEVDGKRVVRDVVLAYGGVGPKVERAAKTEDVVKGRTWDQATLEAALASLADDIQLGAEAPGGMIDYRRTLMATLFFKFYLTVLNRLGEPLDNRDASAIERIHRPLSSATHLYEAPLVGLPSDTVGKPIPHVAAEKQATGEALYTDDTPKYANELYGALVFSTKAHAEIIAIDAAAALALPGVRGFFSAKDVPGHNELGAVVHDEEVFASRVVVCVGAVIGIVVADTQAQAQTAAKVIKITYKELPAILTIEDAIAHKSFFMENRGIDRGNVDEGFAQSDTIIEGELRMGGQEHFYMETQACIVVPNAEGEVEVLSSTQAVAKTQTTIAAVLGLPHHKVTAKVKRMGGGFGGKESRSVYLASAVAVAAYRLGVPVRCMLDRNEDMSSSGGRHPFLAKYKVGATKDGLLKALDITMYNNAGYSMDLSVSILDRALFHLDNAYNIPHVRSRGFCCKTNLPTNTAFRGFGGPQGMFFVENWISDLARKLGLPQHVIRERNFYYDGCRTHYTQAIEACQMQSVWSTVKESANYSDRLLAVDAFNKANRWRKRGLALIPTKFGIAFTATFLNQSGALVHVYTDGSVMLAHGGTEMGQGLHTKMVQVCARALGIPVEKVHVQETSTITVPNTPPTAASASSDLNGMAVLHACEQIKERLQPYFTKDPAMTFDKAVNAAYFDRVSLSAFGFYKTPDIGYDWDKNTGRPFNYFCYGAACTEVELDVLTGDNHIVRSDIVMDVGASLNPAIDIGQVEGAFVQGCGLFTMEELWFSPQGQLRTAGPGAYKIPGFKDIPIEMHVSLLRNAPNCRAVHSSKAVGEPPLFLGSSAYFALKEAVTAARAEHGIPATELFRLDSPATVERVRMACKDRFTDLYPPQPADPQRVWNVIV